MVWTSSGPANTLKHAWPAIRQQLLAGTYQPPPVRRVGIPKPDGSERELGIPTVTDRLIQQSLLQVLQPLIDPTFSEHSHGFRPGRRARDTVLSAQKYMQEGYRVVVDVDLSKFFDRVNHGILIDLLRKRVNDSGILRLVRAYLNAGIMDHGAAIERVMELLKRNYDMLHLQFNESKSAVASAFGRKFLGYSLWEARKGEVKCRVSGKALETFKQRIKQLTRRSGGRSIAEVVDRLRSYVLGWKAYFGLAQTPGVWRELDEWMRHRLQAIHFKHWQHGATIYRELMKLGAKPKVAQLVAGNSCRWWHNSRLVLNNVLTIAYFDRLGMPRLT